jgi:glycosyltransferase involved in cell wall biosynthesis
MPATPGRTLIVMPALNEEATIGSVITEVRATLPDCDILVIDDGSMDSTARVASTAGARVASLPFNLGVGGAMRLGFRIAQSEGYANVVQIDSDGQHDPANLHSLIAGLADADIVIGARFAGEGDYRVRGPRWWAMQALARILSRTTRTTLTDTTSGFKANGPRAVAVFAREYPAEYLGDTIEALVLAARSGLIVRQLPVAMRPRLGGTPSQGPLKATRHLARAFLALGFALIRPRDPEAA